MDMIDGIKKIKITVKEPKLTCREAIVWLKEIREKFDERCPILYNEIIINDRITLKVPGKFDFKNPGDYCLEWDGSSPKHPEVGQALINCIDSEEKYIRWIEILEDVYTNGTKNLDNYIDEKEHFAVQLLFWITVQEDINKPHKLGRLNTFCRYAEAIATTQQGVTFGYEDVVKRMEPGRDPGFFEEFEFPIKKPSFYKWSAF